MTLEEVAERLGRSPNTIKKNFKRTQETLAKQGVSLTKSGDDYNIQIIDKQKVYFTISQLIEVLEEWKEELGDIPVYRVDQDTNLQTVYRVFPFDNDKIFQGLGDYKRAIIID